MESSRVTCPHCDFLFYPEEGVSLDDCPVCGRTVEVKPDHIADVNKKAQPARCPHCGYTPGVIPSDFDAYAQANCEHRESHVVPTPAPQPGMAAFVALADKAADNAFEVIAQLRANISDLTRRLAEAEADKAKLNNTVEMVKHGLNGPWEPGADVALAAKEAGGALQSIGLLCAIGDWSMYSELPAKVAAIQIRAESAEARVRELEATITLMTNAHAHDEQALTATYRSGAHEGKKQAEAERDALRERCGRLERVRRIAASIRFTETYRRFPLAATDAEYAELDAALAATEVKP